MGTGIGCLEEIVDAWRCEPGLTQQGIYALKREADAYT